MSPSSLARLDATEHRVVNATEREYETVVAHRKLTTRLAPGQREPRADPLVFRPVDERRWKDLARLFESPGGPKYCWCMPWRATPEESRRRDPRSRKAALRRRVRAGVPIGILGYRGDEPIAWCSIAPRSTYRRLDAQGAPPGPDEVIWSIACFFVPRRFRGQGIVFQLIDAAVAEARKHGATIVEAYPVEPDSPSYRYMGFTPAFARSGFREVGRAGSRRHVVQRRPPR